MIDIDENYVVGVVAERMWFGDDYFMIHYAIVDNQIDNQIALMGTEETYFPTYRGKRVCIRKDTLCYPDPHYGILGSPDYFYPDIDRDVSGFDKSLEALLQGVNVASKMSVLEERGEDAFVYGVSTFDVERGNVFFLKLCLPLPLRRLEDGKSDIEDYMGIPYTSLALCFTEGFRGLKERTTYINSLIDGVYFDYQMYTLKEGKKNDFFDFLSHSRGLRRIDDDLARGFADPLFMEALCRKMRVMLEPQLVKK